MRWVALEIIIEKCFMLSKRGRSIGLGQDLDYQSCYEFVTTLGLARMLLLSHESTSDDLQ